MDENDILTKEEKLLRKGNLVNSLGVLRAMAINGSITKEHFIELAKRNYLIGIDDKIRFELVLEKDINKVWAESKEKLIKIEMLDIFKSTDSLYVMADKEAQKKLKEIKQKEFEQLVFENTHCKICGNEYPISEKIYIDHPNYKRYGFSEEEGYTDYHSTGYETDVHCCEKCFENIILPLFKK